MTSGPAMTVLILGGTAEARELARALVEHDVPAISSLAGRVADPALPVGRVRVGGFGGASGLAAYLEAERIGALIDATHPFAEQISAHAATAAGAAGRPLLRLQRPGWQTHPRAAQWTWVPDGPAAATAAAEYLRPFLTTGRQSLPDFLGLADRDVLVRVVDPPTIDVPPRWRVILSRGPYGLDAERNIIRHYGVDSLVTKDSGGIHTAAKLDAAAELGADVIVVRRPPPPPDVPLATNVTDTLRWVLDVRRGSAWSAGHRPQPMPRR